MKLREAFPRFAPELERHLAALGRSELAEQIAVLELVGRCDCGDVSCSTFNVTGGRSPLTPEQQMDRGSHLRDSLELEAAEGTIVIDTDHIDRIVCIEVLNRPDVEAALVTALNHGRDAV